MLALAVPSHDQVLSGRLRRWVLGFGPGFTLLMGLAPPTPSAIAFRMSTSTTNFEPTIFTTTPFMALALPF